MSFLDFNQVKVSADIDDDLFKFKVSGEDISGDIIIPDSNLEQPIDINLQTIKIKDQFPQTDKVAVNASEKSATDFEDELISNSQPLPSVKLQCQECIYNDIKFCHSS